MKVFFYWSLAILVTAAAVIYQRRTGPTKEKRTQVVINDDTYKFKLVRSHGGDQDAKVELEVPDQHVEGTLEYRLYPTRDSWTELPMTRQYDNLQGFLPHLPPAGKYEYKVTLHKNGNDYPLNNDEPVIIRFKGHVPESVLFPHIFFMFFAMLLGNLAGIMAVFGHRQYRFFTNVTVIALLIGGMILGPWVQLYAFGEAWAGVPFAWDLTDNKTLVAFLFWALAFFMNRKKQRPVYTIVASIVMLIVYSIPHSMYGSQLDPETGEIIQGWIRMIV